MISRNLALNLARTIREAREKRPVLQKIREFQRFVEVHYENDEYIVTTVAGAKQLTEALELRHEVFVREWQDRKTFHGLDVDRYDFRGDHLTVYNKSSRQIVGTYRLLSSHFGNDFYSAQEFEMRDFLRVPSVKLEMGRACIREDHRNGAVIDLLWKGLTQYIVKTKTEHLFGCSSVKTTQPAAIARLYATLRGQGVVGEDFNIKPTPEYAHPYLHESSEGLGAHERRALIPPLLRSYLHAGAKIYGPPALDREFQCIDIFTILSWTHLNNRFKSRFGR